MLIEPQMLLHAFIVLTQTEYFLVRTPTVLRLAKHSQFCCGMFNVGDREQGLIDER